MRASILLISLFLIILLTGCLGAPVRGPSKKVDYQEVVLYTEDNFSISANYYPSNSQKGLILLHMIGRSKSSFEKIAPELIDSYKIIAIDFRGHGDSDGDFIELTDRDYENAVYEVDAAAKFLESKSVTQIGIVGASFGANIALTYARTHNIQPLVLLSPGISYRGININHFSYNKPFLVQVGTYDAYAYISLDDLEFNWDKARIMKYDVSTHGTDLIIYDLSAKEDFYFYMK